ncbi:fimbrial protein [Janthinobacterium sp. TB1-E2]|uniref:Fimbrial protein n=1 Tax=Janthinobacterium aestuarii TaxID=2985511 RepID=A0ABZ2GYP1_9BURK|nr:fimbrial protein [Janthinobacterium sp. GMG2]MDX8124768.1 fimbrial protein [Janthinobacterium sp. GMG2]
MNIGSLLKSGLAVALLWAVADSAFAVNCTYSNGIQPAIGYMPLQVSAITVGRDVPVGTEVYRQTFKMASGQAVTPDCLYAPFQMFTELTVDASFGLAAWPSGTYANKVYKTSIPGLGVVMNSRGGVLPRRTSTQPSTCTPGHRCLIPFEGPSNFELILIKLGDVTPGVLTNSSLPTVSLYGNFGDARVLGFQIGITGSLQIVSRTCSTPDVSVPMGTYAPKDFSGINSATGWKDFSIRLNDCPAFHGTVNKTAASWESQSGSSPGGTGTPGTREVNSLRYRIDPVRMAINAGNGVLSLDSGAAGRPPAATGIGLQIATQASNTVPLASLQSSGLTLSSTERSYVIALRARYLQTGSKVTPGPANASATFTMSYD